MYLPNDNHIRGKTVGFVLLFTVKRNVEKFLKLIVAKWSKSAKSSTCYINEITTKFEL